MTDVVKHEVRDGIALLTLNRPEKLNAINYAMADALMALLDRFETDSNVRTIILTGSGERAFSAGGDIPEFSESVRAGADAAVRDFVRRGQALTARLESYRKPIIAAVNGIAYGGGCEVTEAVHLAVASERARFAKPEIKLGMPPTFGGTQRLPRLAGRKRALELLLVGDAFSAERARELGIVNRVVPHEMRLTAAREMARQIMRHSPLATGAIITAVTRGLNMGIAEGLLAEGEQFAKTVARSPGRARRLDRAPGGRLCGRLSVRAGETGMTAESPQNRLLEPVVAPEQLAADPEGGCAEDPVARRLLRMHPERGLRLLAPGARQPVLDVLTHGAESRCDDGGVSDILASGEGRARNRPGEIPRPVLAQCCSHHARCGNTVHRKARRTTEGKSEESRPTLEVAPHVLSARRIELERGRRESAPLQDRPEQEGPPDEIEAGRHQLPLGPHQREIRIGARELEPDLDPDRHRLSPVTPVAPPATRKTRLSHLSGENFSFASVQTGAQPLRAEAVGAWAVTANAKTS